ncbi:MAG: cystathionine beta-lyase [Alphaproteobacteria bacterium]|nr:cystathionine beta-lyase [Alphaproteobacteria bacterium]
MSKPEGGPKRPETTVVTAGRKPFDHHGLVNPPVYHASTMLHPTLEALEKRDQRYTYGRRLTPTIEALQNAICELEGGAGTVLCPSGLQACTLALMSVASSGDHVLVTDSVYGPTRTFCDKTLARFGISTTYFDPLIGAGIERLFKSNTRAVFLESPGSLTFEIQDVPTIAATAHAANIAVILDNTWATPLFFDAFGHGADIAVIAATKYVVGHSDAMLGTVTANDKHLKRLRDTHGNLGLTVGPDDIYLGQRGLRTMAVRLKQHEANAKRLTEWLSARPEVARVLYPALPSDPGHAIWKRDFKGASGLFGVELKPCPDDAVAAMLNGMQLFGMGWSWGGYESLIVPAHINRTATKFAHQGSVIRIHAGLENADDLLADLDAGLDRLKKAA